MLKRHMCQVCWTLGSTVHMSDAMHHPAEASPEQRLVLLKAQR